MSLIMRWASPLAQKLVFSVLANEDVVVCDAFEEELKAAF